MLHYSWLGWAPYRSVVDVGSPDFTSVKCPVTSIAYPESPTLRVHATVVRALRVRWRALLSDKIRKAPQCLMSDNLHITNAEFVQHVWPRVIYYYYYYLMGWCLGNKSAGLGCRPLWVSISCFIPIIIKPLLESCHWGSWDKMVR